MKLKLRSALRSGFTLAEVLVAMSILTLLLIFVTQLMNATTAVTTAGNKHMDADAAARALLDRMAFDFGAIVKRNDVDYYLKGRPDANSQPGNDQIAYYSEVAGYYPEQQDESPVSLVAYRLNPETDRVERLGKGLLWNGASSAYSPMVFLPVPIASPLPSPLPSPTPTEAVSPAWPQAASMDPDDDYEPIGPEIFRFEYYYVLKGRTFPDGTVLPSILSEVPWDIRPPLNHEQVSGLQDVAAIGVVVAVVDPKTRVLLSDSDLETLAGNLEDFSENMEPGELESKWQTAVNGSSLPRIASSAIRIYGRTFYLGKGSTIP